MRPRLPRRGAPPNGRHPGLATTLENVVVERLRRQVGDAIASGLAGDRVQERRRHRGPVRDDETYWFAPDRPIRRVHADATMLVGGIRALLLQTLHPLAMAGVAQHSTYRTDPLGRLQRTGWFLGVTTFGTADEAELAVARVRRVHERVRGTLAGRQDVRRQRPAPAELGPRQRGRQLPAGVPALQPGPPGPGWPGRVRRRPCRRRGPARRPGSRHGPRPSSVSSWTPSGPSSRAHPSRARQRGTSSCGRRWRWLRGRRTACSPPRRSASCRAGPGGRCGCRTCRSPKPLSSARRATSSCAPLAGCSPRHPRPPPPDTRPARPPPGRPRPPVGQDRGMADVSVRPARVTDAEAAARAQLASWAEDGALPPGVLPRPPSTTSRRRGPRPSSGHPPAGTGSLSPSTQTSSSE